MKLFKVLLAHLGRDFRDFLGDHGQVALEVIKDRRDAIKKEVHDKLSAAKKPVRLSALKTKLHGTLALLFARILVAQSAAADLILLHGHILTVDARDSVAQAVAIRKGIIVKVGTDAEVLEFAGKAPGIRVIDLRGHTATPGLIDTHAHISEGGVGELCGVKLSDAASVVEIVARVKAKAALVKPGEWITGSGWDEGKLAEHRYVTAADLDVVAPNNPVWLFHTTHHYGVANSAALKLANITAATAAPAASTIDRDAKGNPTGVLKESPAFKLVTDRIPPTTLEQMRQGILYIQQVLHSKGMTAVKDPLILQPIGMPTRACLTKVCSRSASAFCGLPERPWRRPARLWPRSTPFPAYLRLSATTVCSPVE
jgi:hypothetical protein